MGLYNFTPFFWMILVLLFGGRLACGSQVPTIEIKGSKFFYSNNGSQFIIKGVNYQFLSANEEQGSVSADVARLGADTTFQDALSNNAISIGVGCARDIPYLVELQTNVVRSYMVNSTEDHRMCMNQLAGAGIYVLVDLAAPGLTIQSGNPVWNGALYDRFTSVIDQMSKHTNLLGFIVGDNVIQDVGPRGSGRFVKAAVRDMKAHIQQKSYRSIPIGYVNDVVQSSTPAIDPVAQAAWDYLTCGTQTDNIDFFGGNFATFCKGDTYAKSGYKKATEELATFPIPIFFAAYGCSQVANRDWSEIPIIYGKDMSPVWSGAIVYQYFQQGSEAGRGLVSVLGTSSTDDRIVTPQDGFGNVSSRIAAVSPSRVNSARYTSANTASPSCPSGAATSLPPNPRGKKGDAVGQATSTISSTSIATPTAHVAAPTSKKGLSPAAITGISIGVSVCVIGSCAALFFLLRQRASKRKLELEQTMSNDWARTELAADEVDREAKGYGPHMVESTQLMELGDTSAPGEIRADRIHHEVSADSGIVPELAISTARDDVSSLGGDSMGQAASVGSPNVSRTPSSVSGRSQHVEDRI